MNKEKLNKLFVACEEQNYYDFKEIFTEAFTNEFNKVCSKVEKEVNKEVARFDVVTEGISIPLNTPKIKNAEVFAIESDDENMVVKFRVDGFDDDVEYKVPEESNEFYKALEEDGFEDMDDEKKEKLSADLSEFIIDIDKKDESIEKGEELKSTEPKMEVKKGKRK